MSCIPLCLCEDRLTGAAITGKEKRQSAAELLLVVVAVVKWSQVTSARNKCKINQGTNLPSADVKATQKGKTFTEF